ncbi:hypothetical protein [Dokdonia sp. Hel_I_53]|uniref:hypothetical protein n=1 Tax=Dokdonia sp. Hel_I_53 TaxID=1566287 RepID=UPI00119B9684|nr:hypothetical protein [Dokdonia sp. Hel_I_53]TVZ52185.1 hypothetical protein OD90_1355 [Dokdonia sp. Hel_I_53]
METLNTLKGILLCLAISCLIGCDTDIPETDNISPTFRFEIRGDGFSRVFTEEDEFDDFQLNLKAGASFTIMFSGADQGGLKRLQMEFPQEYFDFQTDIDSPWQTTTNTFTRTIYWNGDRENPLTGYVFNGRFIASNDVGFPSIYLRAEDFGGESGPPFNISEGTINISINNHDTEVLNY